MTPSRSAVLAARPEATPTPAPWPALVLGGATFALALVFTVVAFA